MWEGVPNLKDNRINQSKFSVMLTVKGEQEGGSPEKRQ